MSGEILELTDASFKEQIGKGVVLVDFYGTYCPPCKQLEPVVAKLAEDFAGKARIAKVNIDEHSEAAVDHTVDDIPTIVIFKEGVESARLFGAQKYDTLAGELKRILA